MTSAKSATLVDRFTNAGYTNAKFAFANPGAITVAGGDLTITPDPTYPSGTSGVLYDLTDSWFRIELAQILNAGLGSTSTTFAVWFAADQNSFGQHSQRLELTVYQGHLIATEVVSDVETTESIDYDPAAHRWLRFREKSGTVYWEFSSDGLTDWAAIRSKATDPAHDYTLAQSYIGAGYWDAETDPGVAVFRNFGAYKVPASQEGWSVRTIGLGAIDGGTLLYKNFFPAADWLWTPIPDSPVLDPLSDGIIADLTWAGTFTGPNGTNTSSGNPSFGSYNYGPTLVHRALIHSDTPRYKITFAYTGLWGADPFGNDLVPIPRGLILPPGTDGHLTVVDPVNGKVYSMWQSHYDAATDTWSASWGGVSDFAGDGLERGGGSSTATSISRYAGVIRLSEIQAREIPHALIFAAGNCEYRTYQYPALSSDGINYRGSAHPIREGQRIQLDPALDVYSIPGITPAEIAIARAMQKYGAYCGDKSDNGNGWGFTGELDQTAYLRQDGSVYVGDTYVNAGLLWDYFRMDTFDWGPHLRVLKNWDGSDTDPEIGFSPP